MKQPIVHVTWEDAASVDRLEPGDETPTTVEQETVGHLVERTSAHVIVAGSKILETGVYRHLTIIPAGMVRKLTVLP